MRVVTPGAERHSQAVHKRRHGMQQPPGLVLESGRGADPAPANFRKHRNRQEAVMPTPATPFAGAAPRLSPARVIAVIAISVFVLFGVLLGGRAFIAAAGGPDVAAPSVSHAEPVLAAPAAGAAPAEQREAVTRSRGA